MNLRYVVTIIGIAIAAIAVLVTGEVVGGAEQPKAATATTLAAPSYCMPGLTTVSQVALCEAEHSQLSEQAASTWPASGVSISENTAIQDAQLPNETGASFYAFSTTYAQAATYLSEAPNPRVSTTTPVWIVTTHLSTPATNHMAASPATPESTYSFVTVIEDAVNGAPIDSCDGCDVVQASGVPQTVQN